MDVKALLQKAAKTIEKYKYILLVFVIGLVLTVLPSNAKADNQNTKVTVGQTAIPLNEQIAALLSKVEGAGKVEVMLSIHTGEEILYQADEDINTTEQTNTGKKETVIISDSQRNESGLVRQTNPPNYLGAIVVCQGADSPRVQLALYDAVSKITGLSTDRISILKMK